MHTKHLLTLATAAVALLGSAAHAGEITAVPEARSTLSRAEVRAELARARAAGVELAGGELSRFAEHHDAASTRSREAVRAEARTLARTPRAAGEVYIVGG